MNYTRQQLKQRKILDQTIKETITNEINVNDVDSKLIISKKLQFVEPVLTVSMAHKLRKNFKSSFILELYWENEIDDDFANEELHYDKLSLITIFRKFF